MKRSKIVSYTSDELKKMPSQSDWEANAAMTDEEIEAAIASDPEEAEMHKDWMKRAKVVRPKPQFYMFHYTKKVDGVILHKVYRAIPDKTEEAVGRIRIIDESGKEALLPIAYFVPVQLSVEAEQSFEVVTA